MEIDKYKNYQYPGKEMVATSLRIEKKLLIAIDEYGREVERSRNWIVNKLLKQSLAEINRQ